MVNQTRSRKQTVDEPPQGHDDPQNQFTTVARLTNAKDHPLLNGDTLRERLETLMNTRRSAYVQVERHVDTTDKSVEQVATETAALFLASRNEGGHGTD